MKTGSAEYDLAPGSTLYLDSIDVEGFDKDGAEFYEFDKGWGEWVLMNGDDAIEDNKSGDESDVKDEIKVGAITLVNDSQLGNQKVVVAPESAGTDEKHYLSWKLKKGEGTKICSNEELNRPNDSDDPRWMTDEEKAEVDTPSILVRVKFSENDIANFEVGGTYKGPMDEPLNLNHVLTADAVDSTGKIRGVSVFWEAKELSGITVEESGETKFSRKGTYHVRPYSRDMEGHKIVPKDDNDNPVWLEVVAQDRASLSSIVISKPDFEDADTTLSEGITALGFDLASYTKFLDQYGEKWEGTKDNPLPVVKYSVSGPNGAAVDREGILTITRPGTYKVTAKAYDMDQEDIGINIEPITIVVTESDYLASITMKEPGMSGPELTLKEKGDYIVIKNLEELLTYKDQNNRLWEGTKPDVTFSLARDPQNAEIKGGNFYAYAPGTYTIVPFADGYKVNSVTITITEEEQDAEDFKNLVLKTEDPGKQYLYTEDDVVELELERFINAATKYGSRWNERVQELKFTLENAKGASIETRTVYDGDDDYVGADKHFFKSSVAGEYIVHVQPRKASEYTKPLDDMLIKVVKGKKVARIEFKDIQSEVDPEDLMINVYNSDYPSIDLSKYLNYYDGFGNLIDPAKDHVKIPDCKYGFVYPESYSEESYELKGSTLTSYEPDVYLVKATMNMTNYEPSDPSDENAKEDIILEAKAGIFFFDINWLHDFGSWKTTKEPTCTADGSRIKECTGGPDCMNNKSGEGTVACNVKIADSIPATGHKWSASYRYSADKNYLYTVCEECGEKMEASITPCPKAPVFTWKDAAAGIPAPSKVPTCTTEGEYNVKTQSGTTVTVKVPALGHAWGSKFTVKTGDEATCTKYGKESIVCERAGCGEIRKDEGCQRTIPKLEHEYDWKYDVDKDGKELKETCGDYGSMVAQCRKCSIKLYDVVPPTGNHKWSAKTVTKATPNRDGTISKVCGVCGKEEVRTIDHPVCKLSKNTCTYNGKAKNPAVKVTADGYGLNKADYTVTYSNNTKAGKATVKVAFRGDQYTGTKTLNFTIKKAVNPLKIKAKTATVKFSKVKKKTQKLKESKVIKVVKKGQGTVTYAKKSGTKKITINKKTGKVTVKKGLKKGTYKVKVKVKAKGNANYKASKWKTVIFKIKVK